MGETKGSGSEQKELDVIFWNSGKEGSKAEPVKRWLKNLDHQSKKQVDKLLGFLRKEKKNLGMPYSRYLGDGLYELRDQRQSGPGYRLYYCWQDELLVILLVGGDKSTQEHDIETAKRRMNDEE